MGLTDLRFTNKQVQRILSEAAEREARAHPEEISIGYDQLVQIAEESQIDPKYLKIPTTQLVKEIGGLEKKAARKTIENVADFFNGFFQGHFAIPSGLRKIDDSKFNRGGFMLPFAGHLMFGLYPIAFYYNLFNYDSKLAASVLTLQIATNLGSLGYELYRHEKNKLVEEMNGQDSKETP